MPPSPLAPRVRRACSSPTFHFALLTNWNTPIGPALVPGAQREPEGGGRLALHLAGVHDEQRAVAPLAGGEPVVRHRRRHALRRHVRPPSTTRRRRRRRPTAPRAAARRRPGAAPSSAARPSRTGPVSQSTTTQAAPLRARWAAASSGAGPLVCRPSVTTTTSARRARSRTCSTRSTSAARSRPARQRRAPAGRQRGQPRRRRPRRCVVGGSDELGVARRGSVTSADLVAALVGVGEQAEHGALDGAHARAGGHRAGGVDDEQHEVALAALADGLAQVAAAQHERRGRCARAPRWCGAAARSVAARCSEASRPAGRRAPVSRPLPPVRCASGGRRRRRGG